MTLNGAHKSIDELKTRLLPPKMDVESAGNITTIRWGGRIVKTLRADLWRGL